jgi:lipid-binding SYLF domain-containing protein
MSRSLLTRRSFAALLPISALAACANGIGNDNAQKIDQNANTALDFLYRTKPSARSLADRAAGILIMPEVTQAGLGFGGAYGTGVLRIGGVSVDYYSATQGSFGLQVGAQQYSYVLFFMTDAALREFRAGSGWTAGAGIRYVLSTEKAGTLDVNTDTINNPVIGIVFAQTGLLAGATVEGTKYTRIIP